MPKVLIAGGGLAGLSAAAALGGAGIDVDLFESRPFLGGRATSYNAPASGDEPPETIDNCQHVLLRCCSNLLDFYQRLGVRDAFVLVPNIAREHCNGWDISLRTPACGEKPSKFRLIGDD